MASGFDGAVRRIETAYDPLGRRQTVTQLDSSGTSGGTVLDQAGFSYDGWGNVESHRQDVDSVLGGSGDDEYEVSTTWAKATGGRASLRRTGITLPSGASVSLDYRSVSGRFDDAVSRVTTLTHGTTVVVSYDYLGLGQVVGTDYLEPQLRWRLYEGNTTGDYTDLDDFGRVVHSRWTKYGVLPYGMSPPNFYHVELGYDENSNILWAKDHVHAGFDVEYGIDGIDRLTLAKEGTLSGAAISGTPTRSQEWELDQVGNWNRDKLDLDGDGFFTGTDEWDDCREHNDVNELLTRDLDCSSSADHTLAYDAAGNLIDDGNEYKYVYDAFYRLRFIKNQSDDVVSEHRYNGLGHRIAVHVDTDDDGDVDGSDTWEHLAYDERWRLVARYWAGFSDPHEEHLHHQAGFDGHGGSSYIDLVALRDRDTDGNGTLDERVYYCQNWRADVSVLVSSSAEMLEWVKYSAYGVPFGLPAGDADSDGDRDAADRTQITAWASAPTYDVRGDLNLDGLVNSNDETLASGDVEMGRGVLSGMGNTNGYAGYLLLRGDSQVTWSARMRSSLPAYGGWSSRDPILDRYPYSMYGYCMGRPLVYVDAQGLQGSSVGTETAVAVVLDLTGALILAVVMSHDEQDRYGRLDGDVANAMHHCINACRATRAIGYKRAKRFLDAREDDAEAEAEANDNDWHRADTKADRLNNAAGQACAGYLVPARCFHWADPCECCCRSALMGGRLWMVGMWRGGVWDVRNIYGVDDEVQQRWIRVLRDVEPPTPPLGDCDLGVGGTK